MADTTFGIVCSGRTRRPSHAQALITHLNNGLFHPRGRGRCVVGDDGRTTLYCNICKLRVEMGGAESGVLGQFLARHPELARERDLPKRFAERDRGFRVFDMSTIRKLIQNVDRLPRST